MQPNATGFSAGTGGYTYTSFPNGATDPNALNVEFDFTAFPRNAPQGSSWLRVWGIGLPQIGQAANLNGMDLVLSAGMQKGLPLANPAQAGVIAQAKIYQAYGNWQLNNQTLEFIINPADMEPSAGVNFIWKAGTSLASAIATTLTQAFPSYQQNIAISSDIQTASDEGGCYRGMDAFASYLTPLTQSLGEVIFPPSSPGANDGYPGVTITVVGNTIYVFDGSTPPPVKQLNFQDLIGQPTWLGAASVSFKTVLRSDIAVGSQIQFPAGILPPYALMTPAAAVPGEAPVRSKTVFQGSFVIQEVHHFGNFRQADADSWATAFVANALPAAASTTVL